MLQRNDSIPRDAVSARIGERVRHDFVPLQLPFLAALVRMPSDNPTGDCAPHAALTADALEQIGFSVERHAVPGERVAAAGMRSVTNLVVRRRFGSGGPVVALNAHGDVVPPGEGWTVDPYGAIVRDGVMYGRGVAVSKSDISTYAFALRALERCGGSLNGTVELHITYDEECGGLLGPGWLLSEGLTRPDVVISAGFTYAVMVAHNGCLHLEVEVAGRSAHAAWPETGDDALEAANAAMTALYSERRRYAGTRSEIAGIGQPNLVIGTVEGGTSVNVVPDRVRFRLDRRLLPFEDPDAAESRLRSVIADAVADYPGRSATVRRILLARPLTPSPAQRPVVEALRRHASRILGEPVPESGMPLFTDARLYSEAGCATVLYGAGPRVLEDANGHRADERLVLADLERATEVVACALADLLAAAPAP
ncbi:M20/M25/M40 family metallo-hydrolase [Acetobacteraceae bacterium KSS8]|uniref:M20/M25/M40 family metallo-hydrolase n=1 Tax=Endosaccharibacter trunci TaxID=2812733 RepID=A0ABT1WB45_9PROT|nr:M20/M25/M40 family metallo-hydrolase [Acetobacteraceae bacterium KSS8]